MMVLDLMQPSALIVVRNVRTHSVRSRWVMMLKVLCCECEPDVSSLLGTAEVNSLTSSETELPYNYYSLPFCKPPEGVKKSVNTINPGTILMGTRVENSPYNFSMLVRFRTCIGAEPLWSSSLQ